KAKRGHWIWVCLIPAALLVWWPLWFLCTGALMPEEELGLTVGPALGLHNGFAAWHILPSWPTLEPLLTLLLDTPQFFVMFWNSMEQSVTQVAGQLLVGAPAAWAISRLRFHGRGAVRGLYIVLMLLPFQVTMVPSYLVLRQFGLLDTPWAVILPGIFSTFPVFIMERGFDAIPREVLESAAIDGADHWHRFWNIGIPLGVPGIISALTLGFLDAWNAIEQPMAFLKSPQYWPLSLYGGQFIDAGSFCIGFPLWANLP
ncbi:carbohydrate ABC transporter permease, partial [uncultured Subdoligranulum sp.]|uniref:carbohydrate ABC transporter permease n=1 Tax=uncultured Subdoligranulum sp. TaxID=512298 RepID=UPI00344F5820